MTRCKLVPVEPTEVMISNGALDHHIGVLETYKAMTKDAPTVQEVDLDSMKKDAYTPDDPFERAEARGYNQALEDLKEKYTKIYAEVKE